MSSSEYSHSSDLSQAVVSIRRRSDLIGYRNVLSYASALGISIFPESAVELHSEPIGQGSRSATFRGILHEHGNDRVVAVKQPNASFTRDKAEEEESIQHLGLSGIIQEVRILADPKLKSHPNLPHVIGAFFKAESAPVGVRPCIIFELATSDFASFVRARSQSDGDTKELLEACLQIANGICALHAYGLVHGDIKPENILMFEREGEVVATVADLGTCGWPSQDEVIVGTQAYWAPEVHLKSPFSASVNSRSRDIYSFGLVAFAAATRYRERPFPSDVLEQYRIQHSEEPCLERLLSKMPCESDADAAFREAVSLCVRTDPAKRPTISAVAGTLEKATGQSKYNVQIMQDVAQSVLTDPVQPRLNVLEQMPLPEHLRSKLQAEFLVLAHDLPSVRTALTLAAFYGGVFGETSGSGPNFIAETQWLLKAIELGSYAALRPFSDKDGLVRKALEHHGGCILDSRGPDFQSPEIDVRKLQSQLEAFGRMGDDDLPATVLRLLAKIPTREDNGRKSPDDASENEEAAAAPASSSATKQRDEFLKRFTLGRELDLDPFNTGSMDLSELRANALHKSAYNDDLETFITLSEEAHLTEGSERLHYYAAIAVSNGSERVASYLADHFHEGPNESWEGSTHLEDSVIFGHSNITRIYLNKEAELVPSNSEQPSILHYLGQHEDMELARLVCSKLKTQGDLDRVLNWKPTGGYFVGNSPLSVAVSSRAWKLSKFYLELGADVNLETRNGPILESIITPQNSHPPTELLACVLDRGANPNAVIEDSPPALEWPILTSNVLAVQELLLHGAEPLLSEEYDFCDYAKEKLQERRNQFPVNVVDEDGQVVEQSWTSAVAASELVADILSIAKDRQPGWETELRQLVQSAPRHCLSKCWLVVGEGPSMAAIEVMVPLYV